MNPYLFPVQQKHIKGRNCEMFNRYELILSLTHVTELLTADQLLPVPTLFKLKMSSCVSHFKEFTCFLCSAVKHNETIYSVLQMSLKNKSRWKKSGSVFRDSPVPCWKHGNLMWRMRGPWNSLGSWRWWSSLRVHWKVHIIDHKWIKYQWDVFFKKKGRRVCGR